MILSSMGMVLALATSMASPTYTQDEQGPQTLEATRARLQVQLAESLDELARVREEIAAERIPLGRRLSDLETELTSARSEYQQVVRLLDARNLDTSNLRTELARRQDQATYLSNQLDEYLRNFESRLHITELQRHRGALEAARLGMEDSNAIETGLPQAQLGILALSLERLEEVLGGTRFEGTAIDPDGLVQQGTFALIGPVALFRSLDGQHVGVAEQRLGGSLEPTLARFAKPEDLEAAGELVLAGTGFLPLDPSLGNAQKIQRTHETFLEHVEKGGPVMIPIFVLAGAALLVALFKWITLAFLPRPSRKRLRALLAAIDQQDEGAVRDRVRGLRGPIGKMLIAGVAHLHEPKELIEEVMHETVLTTRLKLMRLLPFIAICAAAAPLLGLLGTVTGIINTFKLITVFGSGDVKMLSGGISEALITTKFGLIVAIPSLLLHAFLSRKARGFIGHMEMVAVSFVNHASKTPFAPRSSPRSNGTLDEGQAVEPDRVREHVNEILLDMLGPLVKSPHAAEAPAARLAPSGRAGSA